MKDYSKCDQCTVLTTLDKTKFENLFSICVGDVVEFNGQQYTYIGFGLFGIPKNNDE